MVNRFFLVPESKYNMLLSQDQALFDSKKDADSVLKDRKLSPGEKNALYNQKLANVLKNRDDALKRPVKVKVESGSSVASTSGTQNAATQTRQPAKRARKPAVTPKTETVGTSSADEESDATREDFHGTYETPRGYSKSQVPDDAKVIIESIKKEVFNNKEKFQVDDNGGIIGKDRRVVKNSNANRSIEHLFEAPLGNTPPGFKRLRERLLREDSTRQLINQFETKVERLYNFKPDEWNY